MKKITRELKTAPLLTVNDNTAWMYRIYNKYQKSIYTLHSVDNFILILNLTLKICFLKRTQNLTNTQK